MKENENKKEKKKERRNEGAKLLWDGGRRRGEIEA